MADAELAIEGGPSVAAGLDLPRWPIVGEDEREAVLRVVDRGIFTNAGTVEVPSLESEYGEFVGAEYCLATNTGTAALHCCAAALGLGPGDEAIVPAFTYAASAMFIAQQGATPVFCDIDPRTYNLDPASVEERITERTRAIVVVHIHGLPADLDRLLAIGERHGIPIIEDTAQAHGATYGDRIVGSFGACAGTSLNQAKNLPGGEGGFFLTDDFALYTAARRLRYLGEDLAVEDDPAEGRRYWNHGLGWNYRAQELPAAFARAQLRRLPESNRCAVGAATGLSRALNDVPGVTPPFVPDDRGHVYHIYRVRFDPSLADGLFDDVEHLRDAILQALHAEGVAAGVWQHGPLPSYPAFRRPQLRTWRPADDDVPLRPWDPDEYPEATRLCRESFVVGSGAHPMAVFTPAAVAAYGEAFAKVFGNLDRIAALGLPKFDSTLQPPAGPLVASA